MRRDRVRPPHPADRLATQNKGRACYAHVLQAVSGNRSSIGTTEPMDELEEWRAARRKVKRLDRDAEPEVLGPPEAFDDHRPDDAFRKRWHPRHDATQVGAASRAVRGRLRSSCAGWAKKPTSEEFYKAIRAPKPTPRQVAIIHTWIREAEREEFLEAWAEGAYTWRELACAIHRAGLERAPRCADMNGLAP